MNEICFNLWYYLAKDQTIIGLAARAYYLGGDNDEAKAKILHELSKYDYLITPTHPVPDDITRKVGGNCRYTILKALGVESVFGDVFRIIQSMMPTGNKLPEDKLFYATPLFDFGSGFEPAAIGDGFIKSRGP